MNKSDLGKHRPAIVIKRVSFYMPVEHVRRFLSQQLRMGRNHTQNSLLVIVTVKLERKLSRIGASILSIVWCADSRMTVWFFICCFHADHTTSGKNHSRHDVYNSPHAFYNSRLTCSKDHMHVVDPDIFS